MADLFDQVHQEASAPKGDLFDQVHAEASAPSSTPGFWSRLWQDAVVNPAHQVASGAVGAEASANKLTANTFDLLDKAADYIAKTTGTNKGGGFKAIADYARQSQQQEEQTAQQLSGGKQDFMSQVYRGGTQGALEIPQYAIGAHVLGPVAGVAAVSGLSESDKGWETALQAAATGGATGGALMVMGPASRMIRLTGAGAMTYAQARLQGADNATALAHATTMGGMSAMPAGGVGVKDMLPEGPVFKSTLNPVQQSAVDFLQDNDVPLNAGTVTGNKFLKGAQALAQTQPLGATTAMRAQRATEQGLTRLSGELADQAHPTPVTPESAGEAVPAALQAKIENLGLAADASYAKAWEARNDPAHTYNMPVRTEQTPVLDTAGKPTGQMQDAPTMKQVNMPVDVRDIKAALKPVWDEMQWMPASDRASSAGYTAVKNILEGDDFIPAWQAEKGLGGLKNMARVDTTSGVRNASQGIGASIIPDLQDNIDAAVANTGPEALKGLQQGRAFHANKMEVADVADDLRKEPVQAFNQLTWKQDTGIDFLRKINEQAPETMPQVGRAFVQQLFDKATAEGGFGRSRNLLNTWENLGPQTKALLFKNPGLRDGLDNFFQGQAMVAENPNPSGTAVVGSLIPGAGLMIASPAAGGAWLLGGYAASKLLFTPRGVQMLTEGMKTPATGARGIVLGNAIAKMAKDQGGGPDEPPNPEGPAPSSPSTPAGPEGGGPKLSPLAQAARDRFDAAQRDTAPAVTSAPNGHAVIHVTGPDGQHLVLTASKNSAEGYQAFDPTRPDRADLHNLQPDKLDSALGSPAWRQALAEEGFTPENVTGFTSFYPGKGAVRPGMTYVAPEFRRQGLATAMYDAEKGQLPKGATIGPGTQRPDGRAFRAAYDRGTPSGELPARPPSGIGVSDVTNAGVDARTTGEGSPDPEALRPGFGTSEEALAQAVGGAETTIRVPGQPQRYPARYEVRELADIQPSHSGRTFQPNSKYTIRNDRDYTRAENQGKIVNWSLPSEFDPAYMLTESPTASDGAPVIDDTGNVLGGNGRSMILDRVYGSNPQGAAAYRKLLVSKASQFGIDPAQIESMKQPVLVRRIADPDLAGGKQGAVTDFNTVGTASLRGAEKAIADSRRVSDGTLDHIAGRLEAGGQDATLSQVLEGGGGNEVLQRLIDDGVIAPQEMAQYVDRGALTAEGKARIGKLMLGRFFRDPAQLDSTPASIRNKLERIAAPLAKVEGRGDWSLAEPLQRAMDLLEDARAHGAKNLDDAVSQSGLFGGQTYTPETVTLAKALQDVNPNDLTKAVRQYAQDAADAEQGPGLFGPPPTRAEAFEAAFSPKGKK